MYQPLNPAHLDTMVQLSVRAEYITSTVIRYTVNGLRPFTRYSVQVRVLGYVVGDEHHLVVSDGSRPVTFMTMESGMCVYLCVCECAQIINPHQSSNVVLVILYQPFLSLLTVPSAPPQTFTAFLSHLQNSAHFQWSPAPSSDLHGILTGYSLLCRRFRDGQEELPIRETLGNDRLQYELKTLYNRTGTEYNCSIAAQTQAGEGPRSAPVYFATPGGE